MQAKNENETPLLEILLNLFDGKFSSIQSLIAGPREKMRARSLFSDKELRDLGVIDLFTKKTHHKDFNRVEHEEKPNDKQQATHIIDFGFQIKVVKDNPSILFTLKDLDNQHKVIFGTGYEMGAMTVTSNSHKIGVLREMGLNISYFLHQPRSFIEQRLLNGRA